MKYFLRNPDDQAITGPFEVDEIEARLKAGELPADTLATGDIGENLAQIRSAPAEDWMPVQTIPGFGRERLPESVSLAEMLPPAPGAPLAAADEMRFCPGCAHPLPKPLPPGEAGVCERCGRTLSFVPPPPPPRVKLLPTGERKSGGLLAGVGKALQAVFVFLLCLMGGLMLLGFLLLILIGYKCRA